MMFNIIHDTGILKSFIRDDLLHHGMPRVRFQRAARANEIQWIKSMFSVIVFVSKKHKCINNGSYEHLRAWFRDWNFACQSIIKAMRIALNQPIYLQASFEQVQYIFVSNRLVPGMAPGFLAVQFRIRAICLCLNTMFWPGVRQWAGFMINN